MLPTFANGVAETGNDAAWALLPTISNGVVETENDAS
jgi:hypothetical protein